MERIVAAAIREGSLICLVQKPGRYHNVIRHMAANGFPIPIMGEQGFVTTEGRFVGREEACLIAKQSGQIIKKTGPDEILFSEDLW